ncbi:ribonuclease HI [Candidatus Roizmanbacteria bacterium CG_4_10_14_3_um_filter_39_13]|uniref:Ribonuclease HI n=2 Tax=Candidatus Roizmaniibacteriota TaxID=1752723 RepID=A0A2M7LK86_9BACT|nr:MAG: ribonuclease HI [Candidatus Roizmanbacteria bacterium CG03_land_8_20_14_0_80_39_12]PIX68459.1 MAG: ribonuclease HI [Candidatus Roizmanbacteria bacterium CG_4_10_14_3_um_filter_39_13]
MKLTIHTDGGSLNNPGPAACSYIISKLDGTIIEKRFFFLGIQTNNVAEYSGIKNALLAVLRLKESLSTTSLSFVSDSLLMVSQLNGVYKVKNEKIREFVFDIRVLEQQLGVPIKYTHVLREHNQAADDLVKECLLSYHS